MGKSNKSMFFRSDKMENFIKKEKVEEEEMFVVLGIVESSEVNNDSVEEDSIENKEIEKCSLSKV